MCSKGLNPEERIRSAPSEMQPGFSLETPQRLRQNCLCVSPEEVRVGSGLLRGQGLWVQWPWVWLGAADPGMA